MCRIDEVKRWTSVENFKVRKINFADHIENSAIASKVILRKNYCTISDYISLNINREILTTPKRGA